ncbi:MAG TPA: CAP domain-containing protein, partial [Jatrophihabitans sp.]|nr:CAP domain-containing protein [Jatrophihabitans sp.]
MSSQSTGNPTRRPARARRLTVLIAVLASAALTSFAGAAQAATPTESTAALNVYHMLNAERAANHLPALGWSTALVSSARRHDLTMASANVLSHQLPGEPVFSTRISQAGVTWHAAAENIGWTTDRSSAGAMGLESAMYGERPPDDGHRLNILSTAVRYVGIDT